MSLFQHSNSHAGTVQTLTQQTSPQVTERADTERSLAWRLRIAAATLVRGLMSLSVWRPRWIITACALTGCLAGLLILWFPVGLAAFLIALAAVAQPVLFRLKHGRVWELRAEGSHKRAPGIAWAVIVPHAKDQQTWRLDITLHPLRKDQPGWANALIEQINAAADVFDVSVQSMDPNDEPVLASHGYLPAGTLLSRETVLQRFPPARELADEAGTDLHDLRQKVSENRRDLVALRQLTDETLARSQRSCLGRVLAGRRSYCGVLAWYGNWDAQPQSVWTATSNCFPSAALTLPAFVGIAGLRGASRRLERGAEELCGQTSELCT